MFGGNKILISLLPFFIAFLRLFGREVYLVSHGVILSASEVGDQLGLSRGSIFTKLYDFALKFIYSLLVIFSTRVIVFEEHLRDRLLSIVNVPNKIITIPHGVEKSRKSYSKLIARGKLGINSNDFVLLSFGFLIWYKGSDWLIKAFKELKEQKKLPSNAKLIMAGGFSNVHKNDSIYKKYIEQVNALVKGRKDLVITGYLSEEIMDYYFSAADLVILPYRVLISASGPFSFVLSHKKPFLLSEKLLGYTKSKDFSNLLKKYKIPKEDLFFEMNEEDFKTSISKYINDPNQLNKISELSSVLLEERNWPNIGKIYYKTIFG